jgi:hypothetical protein
LKKFFVDTSGKLNLVDIIASGEIVANSLAATTKLTVGNINVSDLITNGLNDDIYANLIEGKSIKAGTLSADKIVAGSLIVGTNVQMGSGSVINWNSVTPPTASQVGALPAGWTPDLSNYVTTGALSTSLSNYLTSSQLTTQLGQDYIVTGKIAANQIVAGTINGFTITGGTITGTTIQSSSDSSNSVVISGNSVVASYGASNIKMTSTYVSNGSTWNIPAIWMNSGNKDVGVLYSLSDSVCLSTANDGIARELDLVSTSGAVNISSSSGTNISGGDLSVFGDINFTGNLLKNGSLFTQVAVFA